MMRSRFRARRALEAVEPETISAPDPIRAFLDWALQRAEGICWASWSGGLDDAFAALSVDLPELGRSAVRWSGAGVLHDSGVEWFAFEGSGRAVLVFAIAPAQHLAARQLGVLSALSGHSAYVVAGGAVPARLEHDLRDLRGVPVWAIEGLGRGARESSAA